MSDADGKREGPDSRRTPTDDDWQALKASMDAIANEINAYRNEARQHEKWPKRTAIAAIIYKSRIFAHTSPLGVDMGTEGVIVKPWTHLSALKRLWLKLM